MAIDANRNGQGIAFINNSGTRIYVYPSYQRNSSYPSHYNVSGTAFGWIDPGELYVVHGNISTNYYLGVVRVLIYYPNSPVRVGYINTEGQVTHPSPAWTRYQDPLHYTKSNRMFVLRYNTGIYGNDGKLYRTLPAGCKLRVTNSTTGATYRTRIYIEGYSVPGMIGDSFMSSGSKDCWADLLLEKGSLSYNRNLT